MARLIKELRRRSVIRAGVTYVVASWVLLQVVDLLAPALNLPDSATRITLYALLIGNLGDRIDYGMGDFRGQWGKVDTLYRSDIAKMQTGLEAVGHDVGGADGFAGSKTRRSIGRWQEANGKAATCYPDRSMLRELAK